jgi:hypothetical protein
VHVAFLDVPGGTRAHREAIAAELVSMYRPSCNEQQYDTAVRDEWIAAYSDAPSTAPLPDPER